MVQDTKKSATCFGHRRNPVVEPRAGAGLSDLKKLKRAGFSLSRILIVEDEPRKVWRNYGNALYVKPFDGEKDDNELQSLRKYLHKIKDTPNFRTLEKRFWRTAL